MYRLKYEDIEHSEKPWLALCRGQFGGKRGGFKTT